MYAYRKQANNHAYIHTARKADIQAYTDIQCADIPINTHTYRHTGHANRHIHAYRQTDIYTDRQTGIHTHKNT